MTKSGLIRSVFALGLLSFGSGTALADFDIQGSTSGGFYLGPVALGSSFSGLNFEGASFGPTTMGPSGTTLSMGTFNLATLLGYFDPFDFRLNVNFTAPAGAGSTTFSADLRGLVTIFGGSVTVDFDNSPIHFNFANSAGSGSFDLSIADVSVSNFSSRSITGRISNATYLASTVSVPEPFTPTILIINLLAVGLFAARLKVPRRG